MPEVVDPDTGGAAITSYNLEWNTGSGTVYSELIGETSTNTNRFYTESPLTTSSTYGFQYRVSNIHGWSDYSDVVTILCAKAPDVPTLVGTSIVGDDVYIDWTAGTDNGDPITAYLIEVMDIYGTWR